MIRPEPVTLERDSIRLEPLGGTHAAGLAAAAKDGALWELWYTVVPAPADASAYVEHALSGQKSGHMLPWAVIDAASGAVIGSTRYHDIVASIDRVEIGATWYEASAQGTAVNPEAKCLLLENAFASGYHRAEFKTDANNAQSRAALLKLGAKEEGTFRGHMWISKGYFRDTVYFSILANEWPAVRSALESRLASFA